MIHSFMIRALLLLVAAVLALAARVEAWSVSLSLLPQSPPSDYETVDASAWIVLARPIDDLAEEKVLFEVEEVLKGEAGATLRVEKDPLCSFQADCYKEGVRYLLFPGRGKGVDWFTPGPNREEPDDDWVRTVRLFAGISSLDNDEKEAAALRKLRAAAAADRSGRYPRGLVRRIDRHFGVPSPEKPFSVLTDMYRHAETDGERLAVLWALYRGGHPETTDFFRSLIFSGEPDWLLAPVAEWFALHPGELPRIEDRARVYLTYPPAERDNVLKLALLGTTWWDRLFLWSLLPGSSRSEVRSLALEVLRFPEPVPILSLPPDEQLKTDLVAVWLAMEPKDVAERLLRLLREEGRWTKAGSLAELAELFEASKVPAERRQILVELFHRGPDLATVWRLLRQAEGWEAELLLDWVAVARPSARELAGLYRSARTAGEEERAICALGAFWHPEIAPLLAELGVLGQGPGRLEPVVLAIRSCPSPRARSFLSQLVESLATAHDLPVMLKLLEASESQEVWPLLRWFLKHPAPEALPHLRRGAVRPLEQDLLMAQALALAGDPEVLELALKILRRPGREDDSWALAVLTRSPLPAAAAEIERLAKQKP